MITLKTLPQATAREVFEQVRDHLLKQGLHSRDEDGCFYRGLGGLECAAGCLIGDDEYEPTFEGNVWMSLVRAGKVPPQHAQLITDLQNIHDTLPVESWKRHLENLERTLE